MIKRQFPLGFQWPTQEPFLFCVHHLDFYPNGTKQLELEKKYLKGRNLGEDFTLKDGFRMYHGDAVPGFPVHPHRGFETITIVRRGYVDHADSMGAAGRYGEGDVQWMTAGSGVQHSEMFPLIQTKAENTVELFQIWLNLPKAKKMTEPYFTMFWSEKIPQISLASGGAVLSLVAGEFDGQKSLQPPPESWASDKTNEVAIWLLKIQKGAKIELPASQNEVSRTLYFFEGRGLILNNQKLPAKTAFEVNSSTQLILEASDTDIEILILQSKPINEPIVQHGPFVMNDKNEIIQTFRDYEKSQFGGWPWPRPDMIHGSNLERFAKYPNGRIEKPI